MSRHALAPWIIAAVVASLLLGLVPRALADASNAATNVTAVGPNGGFGGSVAGNGAQWFVFGYSGNGVQATVTITYLPVDANLMDVQLYTGDPSNLTATNVGSQQNGNSRTTSPYSDTSAHAVYVKVVNGNANRTVTFTGTVAPLQALAALTPTAAPTATPGTATPGTATPGTPPPPTATPGSPAPTVTGTALTPNATPATGDSAPAARTVGEDGAFTGTIAPRRAVWYRFWYGNAGAVANVTVQVSPNTAGADLNFYTGSDPSTVVQQPGSPGKAQTELSRSITLPVQQYVYFAVANNNDSTGLGYSGTVTPAFAPVTLTPTPTPTATNTPTPTPSPTPTNTPVPTSTPTSTPTPVPVTDTPTPAPEGEAQ
jgi:hypothetical protein